jgi:enoyl-CoA hydratase
MVSMHMDVTVAQQDAVTIVTIDRASVRNAVDAETARALHAAFVAFDNDPNARVAILHGAQGNFCAGWDLQAGAKLASTPQQDADALLPELNFEPGDVDPLGPMGPTRLAMSKPVIAAVSGAAVAGGMELALWCDLRVMEEDAYFGVYCRRFGVPLIDGGTVRLPRIVGMGRALDLILTGRKVESEEALQMGLCNRVVARGQSLQAALDLANALCRFPQATMLADRASAYAQWDLPVAQALHQEWARGRHRIADGVQGAARFAAGEGRHGKF